TSRRRRAARSAARACNISATALRCFSSTGVPTSSAARRPTVSGLTVGGDSGSGFVMSAVTLSGRREDRLGSMVTAPASRVNQEHKGARAESVHACEQSEDKGQQRRGEVDLGKVARLPGILRGADHLGGGAEHRTVRQREVDENKGPEVQRCGQSQPGAVT